MSEKISFILSNREPKKHSIRWNNTDANACVKTIYITNPVFSTATKLKVTIEEVTE